MKGKRRRNAIALANMKRSPEEFFQGPAFSTKVGKNRQLALVRKMRGGKSRGG